MMPSVVRPRALRCAHCCSWPFSAPLLSRWHLASIPPVLLPLLHSHHYQHHTYIFAFIALAPLPSLYSRCLPNRDTACNTLLYVALPSCLSPFVAVPETVLAIPGNVINVCVSRCRYANHVATSDVLIGSGNVQHQVAVHCHCIQCCQFPMLPLLPHLHLSTPLKLVLPPLLGYVVESLYCIIVIETSALAVVAKL